MADPKKGTGKKPKGSGRRLYTDENPRDTVSIKFATPTDARKTVAKVKRINKPFARKIQILTVGEQRAKVMGKNKVAAIFKRIKEKIMIKDPKVGTGKKPKGSDRRLYTDEKPKDTVGIKFATPADARRTVAKVKRISKPYARKIQILTVGEQRAKVMGKAKVASIFKKGQEAIRKGRKA